MRFCFFHLRNISKLKSVVSTAELEMLIHTFIPSPIDYRNALFSSLRMSPLDCHQTMQNAATRQLTKSNRQSHITPMLKSLHWLPVVHRIQLKILILTYRALHMLSSVKYAKFAVCPMHPP